MDDNSIYYYLVLVVIALLSKVFGKKKVKDTPGKVHPTKEKPLTFEELIEEFTKQASGEVEKNEEPEMEVYKEEEKEERIETYKDDEIKEIYNKSIYNAEKLKHVNKEKSNYSFFKEYQKEEEENEFAKDIRNMISSPDSAAKAIILSEIINRKYT